MAITDEEDTEPRFSYEGVFQDRPDDSGFVVIIQV